MVHPKLVNSATGSPGLPRRGAHFFLIFAYSLAPSIRCTGNHDLVPVSFISTPCRWEYYCKISLYPRLSISNNLGFSTRVTSTSKLKSFFRLSIRIVPLSSFALQASFRLFSLYFGTDKILPHRVKQLMHKNFRRPCPIGLDTGCPQLPRLLRDR